MNALRKQFIKARIIIWFVTAIGLPICAEGADNPPTFHPSRIIVKTTGAKLANLHSQLGTRVIWRYRFIENLEVISLPPGLTVQQAVAVFNNSKLVEYAQPDYVYQPAVTNPNDPRFTDGTLWGLHNTGQNGGTADADIDAPEAWDVQTSAANVIVAVIDTGVRYDHEDLAANMWRNLAELNGTPGVDDDGNGYIDDIYGINAVDSYQNHGDPMDDLGHGTHVAGTVGARGNNSIGVVGVAWNVQIMALKFLYYDTNYQDVRGYTSDAIECIDYSIAKGAHILNNSWGGTSNDGALRESISKTRNHNMIFVAAAGNWNWDDLNNDRSAIYPASYDVDNIVSVMATTRNNTVPWWSHYGQVRVHLAAPGLDIYSCWYTATNSYDNQSGTSMAAPYVAGALALMKQHFEYETYIELKNRLLSSTERLGSLAGLCQTEGRLNLDRALRTTWPARPPNDQFANAFTLARPSSGPITAVANNVNASEETGEPDHAGNAGGRSVWWNWTAPDTTTVTIKTEGSGFNTLLAVYTGTAVSNLTLVQSDNDGCQCGTSQVSFTPTQGTTYRIAVDGYDGASGSIKLTLQNGSASQPTALQFTATTVQRPSGQFSVDLTGPASVEVSIHRSTNDVFTWTNAIYATVTLNGNGNGTFTDTAAPAGAYLYRASISANGQQSCNAVGYVDFTGLIANGDTMVANVFNRGDNRVGTVFPSPPNFTSIFKWNESTGQLDSSVYLFGSWTDPNMVVNPGEGVIFRNPTGNTLTHTFIGEVVQGYLVNPVPNGAVVRSSMVPQAGRVATDLLFPVMSGDQVYKMENGSYVTYTYNGTWSPSEPVIALGESFWSQKNVGFWWSRTFLVWP